MIYYQKYIFWFIFKYKGFFLKKCPLPICHVPHHLLSFQLLHWSRVAAAGKCGSEFGSSTKRRKNMQVKQLTTRKQLSQKWQTSYAHLSILKLKKAPASNIPTKNLDQSALAVPRCPIL